MLALLLTLWLGLARPAPPGWTAGAIPKMDELVVTIETGQPESRGLFVPLEDGVVDQDAEQVVEPLPSGLRLWLRRPRMGSVKTPRWLRGVVVFPAGRMYVISARVDTDE